VLTVLNVDDSILQKALESEFADFEDAVQYFTAMQNEIKYIITRNTEDYKKSAIPVYTPTEFLTMMTLKGA
jgi:predicted nucleic acid-binding protein